MRSNSQILGARAAVMLIVLAAAAGGGPTARAQRDDTRDRTAPERILDRYASLPVAFVENRGQADRRVRYYAKAGGSAFYLTRDAVTMTLESAGRPGGVAISLRFLGGNPRVAIHGDERAPGDVNDFRGADPAAWRTGIPRFGVVYRELWPGIDLRLHEQRGRAEVRVPRAARRAAVRHPARVRRGDALSADERRARC